MSGASDEHRLLLRELGKVASALARTFEPLCEVVLHDLTAPDRAILVIENNLSGRQVGGPATELGLARIADPAFPDVLLNYPNRFPDGRAVKSTSIGIKDSRGRFVAALCLNLDITYLSAVSGYLAAVTRTQDPNIPLREDLSSSRKLDVTQAIRAFAVARNKDPRALTADERRILIGELWESGHFETRGAADCVARVLDVSRSSIYYYLKKKSSSEASDVTQG